MNKRILSLGLLLGFTLGCAPRVQRTFENSRSPVSSPYAVVVLDKTAPAHTLRQRLGEVRVGRKILPGNFNYHSLLRLARIEAARAGGNAIQILDYREPGWKSPRHELQAAVYLLDDPAPFEREIVWTAARKLTWADFKGVPPAAAAADSTGFRLETGATTVCGLEVIPTGATAGGTLEVDVLAKFICHRSWVREAARDDYTLNHEQRHFDIAELFARKIRQELQINPFRSATYATDGIAYLEEMNRTMNRYQEQYDRETGGGIYQTMQEEWNRRIDRELGELGGYSLDIMEGFGVVDP